MSNPDAARTPGNPSNSDRTTWTIAAVSVDHYENFPVASWLCPPALRPAVAAIYHFARTADDLADEGEATRDQRLADLAAYRSDLTAMLRGDAVSERWQQVFDALSPVIERHALPITLLADLLSAFEQDVVKHAYTDRAELLDYCRRSANPVGRLLLHLYGVGGKESLRQSDAICSALQLANFWQDLSVDTRRGRLYVPANDLARLGVEADAMLSGANTPNMRRLVEELVDWARAMMLSGAPLVHAIPGRAGWELRLVVQGGLRILDKVAAQSFATLQTRPKLGTFDAPVLFWRALRMRAPTSLVVSRSA